jgi:hypothetical protein
VKVAQWPVEPPAKHEVAKAVVKHGDPPVLLAFRYFLDKRPDLAIEQLAHYDKVSQDVLLCLLPLAVQLTEGGPGSPRQAALALAQMDSMRVLLRALAPLVIEKLCFCKSIRGFGDYEPLPEDYVFQPGEHVRIYAELRNFISEQCESEPGRPVFITRLASWAEIRTNDENHEQVWKQEFRRDNPDRSQTQRNDYFDHYHFWLPELRPGLYTLELNVTDLATKRAVRRSLDFRVGLLPRGS